ncbi:Endonuclease, Uma2 family (restriction endonuclease fold) [Bryocella elongata]|uniref:Endonuclease, Uma2 family (Restriction endonuclease fold) n=1 Tax=Bryocella elongata TaxID=863522 RepID=A0A1H5W834_9BACT|nr:Uma2 family endonuclease [Bryocella elongata]SEF95635.1 Endonuclease, Uma2 family (restriction endonuclease fold) [Bryocella elongata]
MATANMTSVDVPLVTVEEYLHTVYSPDVDYVDGRLEDRNVGEFDHSSIQSILIVIFGTHQKDWGVKVLPELRTQTNEARYRVPDLLIIPTGIPREQIIRTPPLLCIEILSPEDRWSRLERKIQDFFTMGVPVVWVFDPEQRVVTVLERSGTRRELRDGVLGLEGTPVAVPVVEVFAVLDE